MDYFAQSTAPLIITTSADNRRSPRKPMRQRVSLGTTPHGIVQGQTRDISANGISVMIPIALANHTACVVRFELLVDGRLVRFSGHGKVVHCSLAGMEGFRVGMKLQLEDSHLQASLDKFMSM